MFGKARPILAVLLGLLTLLSASRFNIGTHFCSGKIQHLSFLGNAERCADETNVPPCHRAASKSCCEDHLIVHQGDDLATPESAPDLSWSIAEVSSFEYIPAPSAPFCAVPESPENPPPGECIYLRFHSLLI